MKMTDIDNAYKGLASAIVVQAIHDYGNALSSRSLQTIRDCEKFFASDWFHMLSEYDGATVRKTVRDRVKKFDSQAKTIISDSISTGENACDAESIMRCPICGKQVNLFVSDWKIYEENTMRVRYFKAKCVSCKHYIQKSEVQYDY